MSASDRDPEDPAADSDAEDAQWRCDFCGEPSESVRRIALDGDYERLRTRHKPQYACPRCSEHKERERLGLDRR